MSNEAGPGLFRGYRVLLKVRHGTEDQTKEIVLRTRTQGAARREAVRAHPGYVVVEITRLD